MVMIAKSPVGVLLILFSVLLLGACSSKPNVLTTPLPVEDAQARPPTETSTVEILIAPSSTPTEASLVSPTETAAIEKIATQTAVPTEGIPVSPLADILFVAVSGAENTYQFSVEISSPDTGCEQYADWWEVITEDGELIYRRILAHSHVSEQPFRRSGGPAAIDADTVVIVRAHMHPYGYGGEAFRGSVAAGFEAVQLETGFAAGLEEIDPLPSGCGF